VARNSGIRPAFDPTPSLDVRSAVTDVLFRYATGIDSRNWVLLRSCFRDDCDADYGDIGHWRSADEITAWMSQTHDPLGPTLHRITNVTMADSERGVSTRCYVHGIITLPDRSAIHAYGLYDDVIVSRRDGWKIARRRFTSVTTETHPPFG
jgi:3-phenylpropionate/cinnamic acid dioxygenase small subunit